MTHLQLVHIFRLHYKDWGCTVYWLWRRKMWTSWRWITAPHFRSVLRLKYWAKVGGTDSGLCILLWWGLRYLTAGHRRTWRLEYSITNPPRPSSSLTTRRLARQQWWLHTLDNVGRAHNTGQTVLQTMLPTWFLPTYSPPYLLSYLLAYLLAPKTCFMRRFEHASFAPWPTP